MKSAKQLIDELCADGFTQARIAELAEVTQATISRMQAGVSEGRAGTLRKLFEIHQQHFGDKTAEQVAA
ncbi:putative transcriptional regulator [Paraburkholderia bannensis]|uniref:Putative transcriptional regulator n=1 Tax=Paraburkholderia bannensis TaxID=765414 RepID=A0A7W9TYJ3_9BURK|nr:MULTISPECIES: hypothetical protein [Paraburkholderia]MBB3257682.1 putative transcriptional regulator [Paraburkholderia sp. WP4_3_2]MBB6102695.1 putative transcriptional regulator [Paraburkholderia bannensis]